MTQNGYWLLIDAGNSRIKWGWASQNNIVRVDSLDNQYIERDLSSILGEHAAPVMVLLANSAGDDRERQIQEILQNIWGISPQSVCSASQFGTLRNGYYRPEQLGVDRWLGMVAAWYKIQGEFCLVDCGTAVTIDLVDGSGHHQGGVIMPGLGMRSQEFAEKVQHLPSDQRNFSPPVFGKSTEEGLRLDKDGSADAVSTLVDEILHQHKDAALVLTGGDAELLQEGSHRQFQSEPNLVLEGLFMVAKSKISQ